MSHFQCKSVGKFIVTEMISSKKRLSHSWELLFSRKYNFMCGGYTAAYSHTMCECERDIKLLRDVTP